MGIMSDACTRNRFEIYAISLCGEMSKFRREKLAKYSAKLKKDMRILFRGEIHKYRQITAKIKIFVISNIFNDFCYTYMYRYAIVYF